MARKLKNELPPIDLGEETLGSRIARLRKEKGLTQKQLADSIGIERSLITDYERGKIRMYSEMIARFAIALDVTTDELIGVKKRDTNYETPSLRLMKRIYELDQLPEAKKKAILKTLDDLIRANQ